MNCRVIWFGNEPAFNIADKANGRIEPVRILALRAGQQNDLVALCRPGKVERVFENAAPIPTAAMGRQGDDVFNDSKGFGAAGKIMRLRAANGCVHVDLAG